MPIRPDLLKLYPDDWPAIRQRILDRAGNKCEGSPQYPDCRAPNGWFRDRDTNQLSSDRMRAEDWAGVRWNDVTRIVLTIGHRDHNPQHNNDDNLRAWCQRCHLSHDKEHHKQTAAITRYAAKNTGELFS
jgi:hypothetical protein